MAPAGFHVSWGLLPKASTVGAATLADRSFAVSFPWAEIFHPVGADGRRTAACQKPVSTRIPKLGSTPAPGVAGRALAASSCAHGEHVGKELFSAYGVFREGAENSARGGRAHHSISEFGFKIGNFR